MSDSEAGTVLVGMMIQSTVHVNGPASKAKSAAARKPTDGPVPHTLRLLLVSYQDYHALMLIELRQARLSYQDYHMLSLTLAGRRSASSPLSGSWTLPAGLAFVCMWRGVCV